MADVADHRVKRLDGLGRDVGPRLGGIDGFGHLLLEETEEPVFGHIVGVGLQALGVSEVDLVGKGVEDRN